MTLPIECTLAQPMRAVVEDLWRDGFATVRGMFTQDQIQELRTECSRLMCEIPRVSWMDRAKYGRQYRLPIFFDRDWSVLSNTIGLSKSMDQMLQQLFESPNFNPILRTILGINYKIWEVSIRRSEQTDSGLRMHQDAKGEFGLGILLNDVVGPEGTTVFLPGSHRYPVAAPDTGVTHLNPKYLRRWVKPAAGNAGDVVLFCKSVWHGRLPAVNAVANDAILMSFVAAGYDYPAFDIPAEMLAKMPLSLAEMLDPIKDTELKANGRRLILNQVTQPPRLIDALYHFDGAKIHPAQIARIFPPLINTARKVKRAFGRSRESSRSQ